MCAHLSAILQINSLTIGIFIKFSIFAENLSKIPFNHLYKQFKQETLYVN